MSSCSLVIVHASLKNIVPRKTRLKFLVPESGGRTWRDKKIHDFHNFSNSGLKFYMRIPECICNRIMMKKKRFFDPFTGEAPLKFTLFVTTLSRKKFICTFMEAKSGAVSTGTWGEKSGRDSTVLLIILNFINWLI